MMPFDYYYGSQADQFSFIRIPRLMLTDSSFADLSLQAKVLYGVLLDRMSLSRKNAWFDDENRVFFIYQIDEIMEDLKISKKRAMGLLSELESFGLLEKKRRGHGLPNVLYVKSFMITHESRSAETGTSRPISMKSRSDREGTLRSTLQGIQVVTEPAFQEVPKPAPLKNYTYRNQTDMNQTQSNQIVSAGLHSSDPEQPAQINNNDAMRFDGDAKSEIQAYRELIEENIGYQDLLVTHPHDRDMIDGIVELIQETVLQRNAEILIASSRYPAELVRSKLLKLNYSHIEYVLYCLHANTTKVNNIKKYLLAALFNAPSTIDGYYQAEVHHDMPWLAAAR